MKRLFVAATLLASVLAPMSAAVAAPADPINLAFGTEPTQSSTHQGPWPPGPSMATTTACTHTPPCPTPATTPKPGGRSISANRPRLTEIVLWNRTDCCSDRLDDFHVLVSDEPFTSTDLDDTIAQSGVSDYPHPGTAGTETRIDIGRTGRYVRVQLEGRDYLTLAEVEIFSVLEEVGQPTAPTLDVDVFVDGLDAFEAPGPVVASDGDALFTYQVTNLSDETLYGLYLWQDGIGGVDCPATKMYPGELVVCEITVDVGPGDHTASVSAEAWTVHGDRASDAPDRLLPGRGRRARRAHQPRTRQGSPPDRGPADRVGPSCLTRRRRQPGRRPAPTGRSR